MDDEVRCERCGASNGPSARSCYLCGQSFGESDHDEPRSGSSALGDARDDRATSKRTTSTPVVALLVIGVVAIVAVVAGAVVVSNHKGGKAHSTSAPLAAASSTRPSTTTTRTAGGGPAVHASLGLVQKWATALAAQDWATVRAIDPALAQSSDQALASGYGGLKEVTISYVSGDSRNLDVASVAHEDIGSGPRTNVYCYHVAVGSTVTTLTVLSQRQATRPPIAGWVDPATLSATIAGC